MASLTGPIAIPADVAPAEMQVFPNAEVGVGAAAMPPPAAPQEHVDDVHVEENADALADGLGFPVNVKFNICVTAITTDNECRFYDVFGAAILDATAFFAASARGPITFINFVSDDTAAVLHTVNGSVQKWCGSLPTNARAFTQSVLKIRYQSGRAYYFTDRYSLVAWGVNQGLMAHATALID
jgi:hypothetical protein